MKKILLAASLAFSVNAFAQTINEIDSISFTICDYLDSLEDIKDDETRLQTLYKDQFYPVFRQVEESRVDEIGNQLYFRLQRNCLEFRMLLDKIDPPKENPTRTTVKPEVKLSTKELKTFKKIQSFYYFEVNGDTTRLEINDNIWTDNFADGTYSKLSYEWEGKNKLVIQFIESNNRTRSNFSVKGDKYIYTILEKKADHYVVSVQIEGQTVYEIAKLYISK